MIKYLMICLFLVMLSIKCWAQQIEKESIQLHGIVLDGDSLMPLPSAHVILNGKKGTTPGQDGKFVVSLQKQDTVLITHVGYSDYLIPIPADLKGDKFHMRVLMSKALIELEEVVIYRWPNSLADFKEELLAMEVTEEERIHIPGSYNGPIRPSKTKISSPISFLYQKFSRAAKQEKRFEATKAKMEKRRMLDAKYHPELVRKVTGIEDEKELEALMAFCEIEDQFVERANRYDLIVAINKCYDDYKLSQQ